MNTDYVTNGNGRRGGSLTAEEKELIRQRNVMIIEALKEGRTHAAIAQEFGVSTSTVSQVKCYQMRGLQRPTQRKKAPQPLLSSPAMVDVAAAEADLLKARREVLVCEAIVLEARAQLLRQRAYELK